MSPSSLVKLILVAAVAVIICSTLTESAHVRHSIGHHQSHHHQARNARSSDKAAGESVPAQCTENAPCGWAVYTRFTRVVDYFMKNTCLCPTGTTCIRVDDDVSVSAYIYKCRPAAAANGNSKGGDGATS